MAGFACGADRSARDAAPTNLVGEVDIRRTAPATPERAILLWAQAVQFGDLAAVESAYTRRVREAVSPARLRAAAAVVSAALGRPEIVFVSLGQQRARVRVALVSYDADGRRSVQPTTFLLRREGGRWQLDDADLLLDTAAALRRARR